MSNVMLQILLRILLLFCSYFVEHRFSRQRWKKASLYAIGNILPASGPPTAASATGQSLGMAKCAADLKHSLYIYYIHFHSLSIETS
jgi:hypothetical protein